LSSPHFFFEALTPFSILSDRLDVYFFNLIVARHLHQRIAEQKYSAIGKHLSEVHGNKNLLNEGQFRVLKKCHGKFES